LVFLCTIISRCRSTKQNKMLTGCVNSIVLLCYYTKDNGIINVNDTSLFSLGSIPALCPTKPVTHCVSRPSTQEKRSDCQPDHSPHLVTKFRMSGAIPSLLTYAFMPWTETTIYVPIHLSKKCISHCFNFLITVNTFHLQSTVQRRPTVSITALQLSAIKVWSQWPSLLRTNAEPCSGHGSEPTRIALLLQQ
jgi:hypothetical protein